MSNEKPILFSGEMVRAILEGRKTQTRRVLADQPTENVHTVELQNDGMWRGLCGKANVNHAGDEWRCPYGKLGDRLWVREKWSKWDNASRQVVYAADRETREVWFENCEPRGVFPERFNVLTDHAKVTWKPSIHMPRWASRITLEIVKVRVERVQEISEQDAVAESFDDAYCAAIGGDAHRDPSPVEAFAAYWEELTTHKVGRKQFGWDKNPWVWVIELKRIDQGGEAIDD